MSHRDGVYLGRCIDLEGIKARCSIDGECWIWKGALSHGKPNVQIVMDGKRWATSAKRVATIFAGRNAHKRFAVAKDSCPNPQLCVNPDHQKLITINQLRQNHKPNPVTTAKRRTVGMKCALARFAKITPEQAEEIRRRADEGRKKLAEEYGLTTQAVRDIILGKSWKTAAPGRSVFEWRGAVS